MWFMFRNGHGEDLEITPGGIIFSVRFPRQKNMRNFPNDFKPLRRLPLTWGLMVRCLNSGQIRLKGWRSSEPPWNSTRQENWITVQADITPTGRGTRTETCTSWAQTCHKKSEARGEGKRGVRKGR